MHTTIEIDFNTPTSFTNQLITQFDQSLEMQEQVLLEQILRISLQEADHKISNTQTGLSHKYSKLLKNMKMGKSSQRCTVCMGQFQKDNQATPLQAYFPQMLHQRVVQINTKCPVCRLDLQSHFKAIQKDQKQALKLEHDHI